ncbi:MAG: trehalose-6-phosphate synthase [Proteobacteria bacterium]|nr:trehalose-6-phosphate synthase [Pseudomonadota bacterium]
MARVVIVSNRVPIPGQRGPRPGGLTVALGNALKGDGLWFGWSGDISASADTTVRRTESNGITYATIDLSQEDYNRFYVGFANSTLWPLLHFRLGLIDFKRDDLDGYFLVNRTLAAALVGELRPDDQVWIHDYHLIPLGAELRKLGVRNRLGFFLHVPFVPASLFVALPQGQTLLRACLAYDVIGFQTDEHQRDFLDAVKQMLGVEPNQNGFLETADCLSRSIANPAGIDARAFAAMASKAERSSDTRRLISSLVGRALAIGVDRLDYSKGLPNRFTAFGKLLQDFPEHQQNVSYLQIAAKSREDVSEYQSLRRELDRKAGNINGRYAEFDWVPLRYMTRPVSRSSIAGFFRKARIGLVTPLRDGMNLVAKEFVAAQDHNDPGVLILSRFAGAAEEMEEALIVNPYDPDEISYAMHQALIMSGEERQDRMERLRARVFTSTAEAYCRRFLTLLAAAPSRLNQSASKHNLA